MTDMLAIAAGLVVGSFLTAMLHRLHHGGSVFVGRSRCPACDRELTWKELIPLVSFLWQRGQCRGCDTSISWQYPAVVAGTAAVFWGATAIMGCTTANGSCWGGLGALLFFVTILLSIAIYDARWMIIPDQLLLWGGIGAVAVAPFWVPLAGWQAFSWDQLAIRITGAVVLGGALAILHFGSKGRAMGFGDVKLAAVLGMVLGWQMGLAALVIAFVAGGAIGAVLLLTGRAHRKSRVPFGPLLAAAGIVVLIWGNQIVAWYTTFLL